ncbi:response regulator transcription factor [Labedella endophytica]|uniref:Response regulator transcription factor n=2 Tax=Labedella endophytica TaxID=1523160 RepID=A0A3S0VW73_9MICO|nr:response regulator transcription factor [Labedella endophytica]
MRAGLRLMIDGTDEIVVVGEVADGSGVADAVERLDPDVVLMDIRMPVVDGIAATAALRRAGSRARVVILTAFDTDALVRDALLAGAVSFLVKDAAPEAVVAAVHDAAAGRSSFSPTALARLVSLATREDGPVGDRKAPRDAPSAPALPEIVTPREWEVGRLVARGLTNGEIAEALFVSPTTVKTHLSSLFAKLHVTNRVQLAIRVLEQESLERP